MTDSYILTQSTDFFKYPNVLDTLLTYLVIYVTCKICILVSLFRLLYSATGSILVNIFCSVVKCVFYTCWISDRSRQLILLFRSSRFLLHFFLVVLSVAVRGLRSLTMIIESSISLFNSVSFCLESVLCMDQPKI